MAFPRRLLTEHERLILDLRPHWVALVFPAVAGLVVVAVWALVLPNLPESGVMRAVPWWTLVVGGVGVLVWFVLRPVIDWATDNFVVTSDRIIRRQGLIAKRSMEIPLEAINDVRFQQSIVGRMIGAGTLIIQSASEQGREEFANIRDPERVQKTIYEQGELNQRRMFAGATSAPGIADELGKLDRLRDEGVLSDEEFAEQKRRLLRGESRS